MENVPEDWMVTCAAFPVVVKVAAPYLDKAWRATTVSWKRQVREPPRSDNALRVQRPVVDAMKGALISYFPFLSLLK